MHTTVILVVKVKSLQDSLGQCLGVTDKSQNYNIVQYIGKCKKTLHNWPQDIGIQLHIIDYACACS